MGVRDGDGRMVRDRPRARLLDLAGRDRRETLSDSRLETLLQAGAAIILAAASLMIAISAWLDS